MSHPNTQQLGVCSWSLHADDIDDLCSQLDELPITQVQIALNPIAAAPGKWQNVEAKLSAVGCTLVSGMFTTTGEDYSTLQSIRRTGGVVPDEHWDANWAIVKQAARTASELGLKLVSSHAGFMPEQHDDPRRAVLVERITRIANHFADVGVTFLFETGQETAATLLQFIAALDANGSAPVGVNFDPANMILYGRGEPVAALREILPRVQQVHIKDARHTRTPGTWGTETPIGEGDVDWPAFVGALREAEFAGPLVIEREAGAQRIADITRGAQFIASAIRAS